jgi:GntR family transcriptional repressor for pyruvate dehydrogenase complex
VTGFLVPLPVTHSESVFSKILLIFIIQHSLKEVSHALIHEGTGDFMEFKKLNAPSLRELFVNELQNMILSGKLEIGSKLPPERELAESMKVSRAVINSGIAELEKKGFLVVRPRIGTFVADYHRDGSLDTLVAIMNYNGGVLKNREVKSVLETRIMFMVEATRFAIDRASDEELLGLQEYVYQMENCTDPEKTASLIFEFSHEIAYISGNTLLPLFFISFRDLVCSLWIRYGQKYGTKELYYSAKKIFDCLLARDKEAVKDFITTSTMESIDGSRTIYYVD